MSLLVVLPRGHTFPDKTLNEVQRHRKQDREEFLLHLFKLVDYMSQMSKLRFREIEYINKGCSTNEVVESGFKLQPSPHFMMPLRWSLEQPSLCGGQ